MKVVIIGCGPAGLFAAQAVMELTGQAPAIVSKKFKSKIYGAQYLHRSIPGLCSPAPDSAIHTVRVGSAVGYARRVYKDGTRPTSWSRVHSGPQPIWNLRTAYDNAWEKFQDSIVPMLLSPEDLVEFELHNDLVICTAPKWTVCMKPREHLFGSINIYVHKALASMAGYENFVVYNGTDERSHWYRTSRIFGYESTEYIRPIGPDGEFTPGSYDIGFKVVGNNCDCHPNVVFAGRMGKWEAGVLTHNAYEDAVSAVSDRAVI